jgi:hypothetical protein
MVDGFLRGRFLKIPAVSAAHRIVPIGHIESRPNVRVKKFFKVPIISGSVIDENAISGAWNRARDGILRWESRLRVDDAVITLSTNKREVFQSLCEKGNPRPLLTPAHSRGTRGRLPAVQARRLVGWPSFEKVATGDGAIGCGSGGSGSARRRCWSPSVSSRCCPRSHSRKRSARLRLLRRHCHGEARPE